MKLKNEKKAMELFMSGNIFGLEEMKKQVLQIKAQRQLELEYAVNEIEEILKILDYAMATNYLLVETETESYASSFNGRAKEFDNAVLNRLFQLLEIDVDFWWEYDFNDNDKYSKQGRVINRTATDKEIKEYLGLEDIINNKGIMEEYRVLEKEYANEDVDFCLLCDTNFCEPIKIIKQSKSIIVFE